MRSSLAPLLVAVCAASCASTTSRTTLAPLVVLEEPAAEYVATIGGPGSAPEVASFTTSERTSERVVEVLVDVVHLDRGALSRLVGWSNGARVWTTTLDGAQAVLAEARRDPDCERVTAPRVVVHDGQRAAVNVINQVAYVSHYEMHVEGAAMVADPHIGVAQDGLSLDVLPRVLATGAVDLDLRLQLAHLERPFAEEPVPLPGSTVTGTIHVPITTVQRVTSRATVAPDQCLVVLANVADDPDEMLLLLLHAQQVDPVALATDAVPLDEL